MAEREEAAVSLTILQLTGYHPSLGPRQNSQVYVEISNETNRRASEQKDVRMERTRRVPTAEKTTTWSNQSFFYNSIEMQDDNITFILRDGSNNEIGRSTIRNLSQERINAVGLKAVNSNQRNHGIHISLSLDKTVDLVDSKNNVIGKLNLRIKYLEKQGLVGGVLMPDLSLVPSKILRSANLIDNYKTPKLNCYSFLDEDKLPGFDDLQSYPRKYKLVNEALLTNVQ